MWYHSGYFHSNWQHHAQGHLSLRRLSGSMGATPCPVAASWTHPLHYFHELLEMQTLHIPPYLKPNSCSFVFALNVQFEIIQWLSSLFMMTFCLRLGLVISCPRTSSCTIAIFSPSQRGSAVKHGPMNQEIMV